MADVGFDSQKHAQTSGDMEKGGQSLTDSTQAISRLMDAQKAEYWSEEEGFQAMRRSLISYLRTEKDVVSNQTVRFEKFDGDVDTAVSAFEAAEQGNTCAQYNLGYYYQEGYGVSQDLERAIYWYSKSAEQGNTCAQEALVRLQSK